MIFKLQLIPNNQKIQKHEAKLAKTPKNAQKCPKMLKMVGWRTSMGGRPGVLAYGRMLTSQPLCRVGDVACL